MPKRNTFTKTLAILGTIFTCLPLLAPFVFSLRWLFRPGAIFHFDYLMPAELFPLAWLGGLLLVWAAIRARLHLKSIAISAALMVFLWLAANGVALATGLASGRTEPEGLPWIFVVAGLILFTLSILTTAILGILLLRDLFKPSLVSDTPH